jgi:hypothetical protein
MLGVSLQAVEQLWQETRERLPARATAGHLSAHLREAGPPAEWARSCPTALVGAPTVVVTHAYADPLEDTLLPALREYAARLGQEQSLFWIDFLCRPPPPESPADDLAFFGTEVRSLIAACRRVLVVANALRAPRVLTRVFCVWDVGMALDAGAAVEVLCPAALADAEIREAGAGGPAAIAAGVPRIHELQGFNDSHRAHIMDDLHETVGEERLREALQQALFVCYRARLD